MSRGRKRPKSRKSGVRVIRSAQPPAQEPCDCPACLGEELDPQQLLEDLVADAADLLTAEDPLDVELFGASFSAFSDLAGGAFMEGLVSALAAAGTTESLAVLLALDAVDDELAASGEIAQLISEGVTAPGWAAELGEPLRVDRCESFSDGEASMLICTFDRAGRSHAFVLQVDHTDCDAALDILLVPGTAVEEVIASISEDGRRAGVHIDAETLDPAEFRWRAERALDARVVHDEELDDEDLADDLGDEDGPGYLPMATLLRARIRTLPEPTRPPEPHGSPESDRRNVAPLKLPAKRKKSNGPAPIYQINVGLLGAKPPIWRRLELAADTSLARLHEIIQVAFGWEDSHLHVFETAYGRYGRADRDSGHLAEKPVTLEQVAPAAGDKLNYTYDFGDDWTHEIVIEKVLTRDPAAHYPRCTGGRRAAPPEDCGGIWGYTDLLEILADPAHPEHADRLEWLGLKSAQDFNPDNFAAPEITRELSTPGGVTE